MANEELPVIKLILSEGSEFEATPLNAELFTFIGHSITENGDLVDLSARDHIFLTLDRDEENKSVLGHYIFGSENVARIGCIMLDMGFPASLNQRRVHPSEEDAYQQYLDQMVEEAPDFMPDDWSDDA